MAETNPDKLEVAPGTVNEGIEGWVPELASDDDLRRFCEFLYQRTGISYSETKRFFIERRLAERMEQVGTRIITSARHSRPGFSAPLWRIQSSSRLAMPLITIAAARTNSPKAK